MPLVTEQQAHAPQLLSLRSSAQELQLLQPVLLETETETPPARSLRPPACCSCRKPGSLNEDPGQPKTNTRFDLGSAKDSGLSLLPQREAGPQGRGRMLRQGGGAGGTPASPGPRWAGKRARELSPPGSPGVRGKSPSLTRANCRIRMCDLVPPPGVKPLSSTVEAWSPNHRSTSEDHCSMSGCILQDDQKKPWKVSFSTASSGQLRLGSWFESEHKFQSLRQQAVFQDCSSPRGLWMPELANLLREFCVVSGGGFLSPGVQSHILSVQSPLLFSDLNPLT
ncbi:uncharacterized protein LOC129551811 [Moschus berezovskii]|uniref:uncharacterized protein LOC129551811 n=1 Tax=Moschus berezovskii TaxID=68408 RepID=UPI002443F0FF|nr:uncharacterized protein LOC129551811 [Moschus berezovskii]